MAKFSDRLGITQAPQEIQIESMNNDLRNSIWNWFLENEKAFFNAIKQNKNIEKDVLNKLSRSLNEVKEGCFFLVGMLNENTAELVITPDGSINNIVFVEELVNAAPKIDSLKFTALKPALDINDVNIKMAGYEFNSSNLSFFSNEHPQYPDEIDITVERVSE